METKWKASRRSHQVDRTIVINALLDLQTELQKIYGGAAPAILVYGSFARNEANADSDIDVLLLYRKKIQPGKEIQRISAVLADLNIRYQVLISILPGTEKDYQNAKGALWQNIRRESVPFEKF
jgi:predicted nucleotidyltransferase